MVSNIYLGKWSNLTGIFLHMGCFNHQLAMVKNVEMFVVNIYIPFRIMIVYTIYVCICWSFLCCLTSKWVPKENALHLHMHLHHAVDAVQEAWWGLDRQSWEKCCGLWWQQAWRWWWWWWWWWWWLWWLWWWCCINPPRVGRMSLNSLWRSWSNPEIHGNSQGDTAMTRRSWNVTNSWLKPGSTFRNQQGNQQKHDMSRLPWCWQGRWVVK